MILPWLLAPTVPAAWWTLAPPWRRRATRRPTRGKGAQRSPRRQLLALTTETRLSGRPSPSKDSKRRSLSNSAFKPVFSYVKSRGFYAGIQVDGTIIIERPHANAAFYGEKISASKILKGEVPAQGPSGMWPAAARGLLEVLRGAEAGHAQAGPPPPPSFHRRRCACGVRGGRGTAAAGLRGRWGFAAGGGRSQVRVSAAATRMAKPNLCI